MATAACCVKTLYFSPWKNSLKFKMLWFCESRHYHLLQSIAKNAHFLHFVSRRGVTLTKKKSPFQRFWHSIYYIHTTHYSHIFTNKNIFFLRVIHTNSWYGHVGVLDDLILCAFRCAFSCMFQYSLCHGMDIGTCDIVHRSAAPHNRLVFGWTLF